MAPSAEHHRPWREGYPGDFRRELWQPRHCQCADGHRYSGLDRSPGMVGKRRLDQDAGRPKDLPFQGTQPAPAEFQRRHSRAYVARGTRQAFVPLPDQPDAIPTVHHILHPRWGFCIEHSVLRNPRRGSVRGLHRRRPQARAPDLRRALHQGDREEEIFISTYICHPSMANNELSGPVVTTELAKWLLSLPERRYSYRIVFVPETIGAIAILPAISKP